MTSGDLIHYADLMQHYGNSLADVSQPGSDLAETVWLIRSALDRLRMSLVAPDARTAEEPLSSIKSLSRLAVVRDVVPRSEQQAIASDMYRLAKDTLTTYRTVNGNA